MHINWSQVWDYLYANRLPISGALSLIVTALVFTMPDPGLKWLSIPVLKAWFYDFSHQYFNVRNKRTPTDPEVKP